MALYDADLREKVKNLPDSPGVYQYFDSEGKILYIGKAKNLKNRVSSYLNKTNQSSKTLILVRQIADLKYIVVSSEQDALLLENNLIKQHKPKYNILLKDDKTYPWIVIRKEHFPRVEITRRFTRGSSEYFGPFTSVRFANVLISLIKKLYKLRTCNLALNSRSISALKFKPCLEYHIHNCEAPCIGGISEVHYDEYVKQVRDILKGNFSDVIHYLKTKQEYFATELQFEKAQELKEAVEMMKEYKAKSSIVRDSIGSIDVFSCVFNKKYYYVNYLGVVNGAVVRIHTIELEPKIDEDIHSMLSFAICEIREMVQSNVREIVVPFLPDIEMEGVSYTVPQMGEKRHLLELSERNAKQFMTDREVRRKEFKNDSRTVDELLKTMQADLKLHTLPKRLECFDNSNIQGTNPVASCVVFINGKPAKREYRKFHIKTVVGADDFASMDEVLYRRYSRVLKENGPLPDLIVVDGGKGQLNAALNSLERLNLRGTIPIVGLAKRMEEVYFPGDSEPWILSKKSETLKVLMQIRDEAHRFGITFHRSLRSKAQIHSELDEIEGVGKATRDSLIRAFKSIDKIKSLDVNEIAACIGQKRAATVWKHFHDNGENSSI